MSSAGAVCASFTRFAPGGPRSYADNNDRATKKLEVVGGSHDDAPDSKLTPSLISVLGLRLLWALRRHDDRWGDLLSNTDAAARSFEAVQLGEENLPRRRWQRGASGSRPLPGSTRSTSSYVSGSVARTNLPSM